MKCFLYILLFITCFIGQYDVAFATNYASKRIIRYVDRIPQKAETSLTTLVSQIIKPLDDDYDKAKAIAFWIAGHIKYDEYYYHDGKATRLINNYNGQKPQDLLKSKVGICGDFAAMFKAMCHIAGIKAEVISGYAYPGSKKPRSSELSNSRHAWNYFYYKSKKIYVDTTFMTKGRTGIKGSGNSLAHRKALYDIKKDNHYHNNVNDYDVFYFDFDYKEEPKKRNYTHSER